MIIAIAAGVLVAGAVYLFSRREMLRVILGFVLLGHGVNLVIIAAGGTNRRGEPLGSDLDPATVADPLPQAFVLTAIVIAFSITIVMLVLAVSGRNDDDLADPTEAEGETIDPVGPVATTEAPSPTRPATTGSTSRSDA